MNKEYKYTIRHQNKFLSAGDKFEMNRRRVKVTADDGTMTYTDCVSFATEEAAEAKAVSLGLPKGSYNIVRFAVLDTDE